MNIRIFSNKYLRQELISITGDSIGLILISFILPAYAIYYLIYNTYDTIKNRDKYDYISL